MTGHRTRPALLAAGLAAAAVLSAREPAGNRPDTALLAPGIPTPLSWTGPGAGADTLLSLDFGPLLPPAEWAARPTPIAGGWHLLVHLPRGGDPALHLLGPDPIAGQPAGDGGSSRDDAIGAAVGTVWDGFVPPAGSRWFRTRLQAGDPLWIATLASRAGSKLDPVVRILDPDGRELAEVDDVPGWLSDPVLGIRADRGGEHRIEIRDTRHEGGPDHRFRLHLRSTPPTPHPWRLGPGTGHDGDPPPAAPAGAIRPGDRIRGHFDTPGRTNRIRVDGREGQAVSIAFASRTLGFFADPVARLESDEGRLLAVMDAAGHHGGGLLTHRFERTGPAWLVVWEASGLGGSGFGYEMQAVDGDRFLELAAEPAVIPLPPGGTAEIKLRVNRRRHDLPVHLEMTGLPPGARLRDAEIPAGKREHTARLELPADAVGAGVWQVTLSGVAADDGGRLAADADTVDGWRRIWPGLLHPPAPLARRLVVVVRPAAQERP